jgi:hypothetical protein
MWLRRAVCVVIILALVAFLILVYMPQLNVAQSRAALSVLSDCTDMRAASVRVAIDKSRAAIVDVSLLDAEGKFSAGTCNQMQVEFPGKTSGWEILGEETFQVGRAPPQLKPVEAGTRLIRRPGIGDGDRLSVNFAGTPLVRPVVRFEWRDPITYANFVTNQVALPLAPINVDGSPLVALKHIKLELGVPNELENATLTPSPTEILPVGNIQINKYDFPNGAGVVTLKWTDSVRTMIKEGGVIVLSLLAGAAVSDLVTPHPEPASPATAPSGPPPPVRTGAPPPVKRHRRRG